MTINFKRSATALSLLTVGALTLAACSESESSAPAGGTDASAIEGLSGTSGQLAGEGASSQQKAMDYFGVQYQSAVSGASLSYTASGSGSGQEQFIGGQVAFAGSDSALDDEQAEEAALRCGGSEAWHLPFVIGPVAIAYNLEGVDDLALDTETVARIFNGEITNWNDEAIAATNEGVELPDQPISVKYRSEESGTTENFQRFLVDAAPDFWDTTGKSFPTSVGSGANGSSGVASEVAATAGSITYVESGFAEEQGLGIAKLDFGSGPVELSTETVNAALDNLVFSSEGNNMVVDADALFAQDGEGVYPLILTTYEIVCSDYSGTDDSEGTADMVKDFLTVALNSQDDQLAQLGYIPVDPDSSHGQRLADAIKAIK